MEYRKLWIALGAVLAISFLVLGGVGYRGIHNAPPIPQQVVTTDGRLLFDGTTIQDGQNVWHPSADRRSARSLDMARTSRPTGPPTTSTASAPSCRSAASIRKRCASTPTTRRRRR